MAGEAAMAQGFSSLPSLSSFLISGHGAIPSLGRSRPPVYTSPAGHIGIWVRHVGDRKYVRINSFFSLFRDGKVSWPGTALNISETL